MPLFCNPCEFESCAFCKEGAQLYYFVFLYFFLIHTFLEYVKQLPPAISMVISYVYFALNIVQADQSGTVVEILAEDGKPVSVDTVSLLLYASTYPFSYMQSFIFKF